MEKDALKEGLAAGNIDLDLVKTLSKMIYLQIENNNYLSSASNRILELQYEEVSDDELSQLKDEFHEAIRKRSAKDFAETMAFIVNKTK